jgi:uncharacterized protein
MKTEGNLKIVHDTNVLLVSISGYSKYHWLYQKLINKEFDLFITNEILTEYEEVISEYFSPETSIAVIRTLLELSNVIPTITYYRLNLIKNDLDDNKFVDCSFACNANYLVTNDKHFDILKNINFPRINIPNLEEFKNIFSAEPG